MAVPTIEPPPATALDLQLRRHVDHLDALAERALKQVEPPKPAKPPAR